MTRGGRRGYLHLKPTEKSTATADAVFFEATAASALGEARVCDGFVLRDGKATHHCAEVILVPPAGNAAADDPS